MTLLPMAVKNARIAATLAAAFLIVVGALGARLGTEFLPKLEEGNLWIRAVMPPTITLEAGMEAVAAIRRTIMEFAPVQTVASRPQTRSTSSCCEATAIKQVSARRALP